MRYALAREETASKERSFDDSRGIGLADVQGSLDYVLETKVEELRSTFAALSEESVTKAVGILSSARIAMFVGVGSSCPSRRALPSSSRRQASTPSLPPRATAP